MRIECKSSFLDGAERFEAGDIRTVSDARGHRFMAHGWAAEVGQPATPQGAEPVTLDIHNAANGTKDSNG
jgi:hypothetical protein